MTKEYGSESITVLEGIDHIRTRPGMYIPNLGKEGLHHLIREVIDNVIDEYMCGQADELSIHLNMDDFTVSIKDNGRGIPVGINSKSGMSTLNTVFMKTGSGGKFDKESYSISAGLHGVGVTVVNALSDFVEVWVNRPSEGGKFYQKFVNGVPQFSFPTNKFEDKENLCPEVKGTTVKFKPNRKMFKDVEFDKDLVWAWLKEQSYLCSGLHITIRVTEDGKTVKSSFVSKNGLSEMISDKISEDGSNPIHDIISFKNDDKTIDCVLCWTDSTEEEVWSSYVNSLETIEGGTHVTGVIKAITEAFKNETNKPYIPEDLRGGLYAAISVKVSDPLFKGQTKQKLLNQETTSEVYSFILEKLQVFIRKNPSVVKSIIDRACKMYKARESFRKEKEALKNITIVGKNKKGVLPGKLIESPFCKADDRELYLVEGDSAGGTVKMARNSDFQELLPLRGKIPNASRYNTASLLKNEEIQSIITAIGCGIYPNCDPKKARIGKLMLLMDADPDGCFTGDTKVPLLNGEEPTFEELVRDYSNKEFWVYSRDELGNIVPGKAHHPRITKYVDEIVEIILETSSNDELIKCTLEHPFLIENKKENDSRIFYLEGLPYIKAIDLNEKDIISCRNKKVKILTKQILKLENKIPVYDLTVDTYHNFALSSGVFVHNSHITSLALSFLTSYMWELIEAGMVYIVRAPLFITTYKDVRYFGDSLQEVKNKLPKNANVHITRLKGHGEANVEDLEDYAMNPLTRKLYKVVVKNADKTFEGDDILIDKIMGIDGTLRKEILGISEDHIANDSDDES